VCVRGCVCSVLGFIHRFVTQSVVRSRSVLLSLHWLPQLSLEFNFLLSAVLDFQFLLSRRTFHFKFSQFFVSSFVSQFFSLHPSNSFHHSCLRSFNFFSLHLFKLFSPLLVFGLSVFLVVAIPWGFGSVFRVWLPSSYLFFLLFFGMFR
jgi:hypothetical protein